MKNLLPLLLALAIPLGCTSPKQSPHQKESQRESNEIYAEIPVSREIAQRVYKRVLELESEVNYVEKDVEKATSIDRTIQDSRYLITSKEYKQGHSELEIIIIRSDGLGLILNDKFADGTLDEAQGVKWGEVTESNGTPLIKYENQYIKNPSKLNSLYNIILIHVRALLDAEEKDKLEQLRKDKGRRGIG